MAHPDKHIRAAIAYAEQLGWRFEKAEGRCAHLYGTLKCPEASREGCRQRVDSTPRNVANHVSQILRAVKHCPHC